MNPAGLLCHSDGHCNLCRIISSVHVGCDAFSSTPVCDADTTTAGVQNLAEEKPAECSGCKKDGSFAANTSAIMKLRLKR